MISSLFRFLRKKEVGTVEKLEKIEDEIVRLESSKSVNIDAEKRFVFRLLIYSFIVFGVCFIAIYYYYWPTTQTGKALLTGFFLLYPSIVGLLKCAFRTFFLRKVCRADVRLKDLRNEKQKLLEDIMERETYNKAQQILKRFDPLSFAGINESERVLFATPVSNLKHRSPRKVKDESQHSLRDRAVSSPCIQSSLKKVNETSISGTPINLAAQQQKSPDPRLPRPILPRERSWFDRIIDGLVGDGPDRRYALICQNCNSHNGMALKEEFEFLAFRCCYCCHFNPPRRSRIKPDVPSNISSPTRATTDRQQAPIEELCESVDEASELEMSVNEVGDATIISSKKAQSLINISQETES